MYIAKDHVHNHHAHAMELLAEDFIVYHHDVHMITKLRNT